MKASNLGVVFGPTLMRAEVETVATIVDIKYQNIIVQEMIEQKQRVHLCMCTCAVYFEPFNSAHNNTSFIM